MLRVILESPFNGDVNKNIEYAKKCMKDCIRCGESPMCSHLLYTQILDDKDPDQRKLGIKLGFAWRKAAHYTVVFTDLGISKGMIQGINHARDMNQKIEYRKLY